MLVYLSTIECVNIKTRVETWAQEISWTFGSCQSPANGYENDHTDYNAKCCQPHGTYELNCKDSHGDGWHGAYLQIGKDDEYLCRNFTHGHSLDLRVEHKTPGNLDWCRVE